MENDYRVVVLPDGNIRIYFNTMETKTIEEICREQGCNTIEELYEKLKSMDSDKAEKEDC